MFDIICVTNRKLCREDLLYRIENIAKNRPKAIILREKDMSEDEYRNLAEKAVKICKKYNVKCILHSFAGVAKALEHDCIHFPMHLLRELSDDDKAGFKTIGASCHSVEEAKEAKKLGCSYIIAGHIFDTDCKKGLKGRGLKFLEEMCQSVDIKVYAIGGINSKNLLSLKKAGANGACVMSSVMQCEDVGMYMTELLSRI